MQYDYAENGEDPVATFSATDPDADAGDIEWSLERRRRRTFFEISDEGVLTFEGAARLRDPEGRDEDD